MQKKVKRKKENIWNVPNFLTFLRVVITFITIYAIFARFSLTSIAILFIIGMITDFLDGQIARRWKLVTEFGRKFDMIADRLLMIGVAGAIVIDFSLRGLLMREHLLLIFLIISREIVTFPFAVVAFVANKPIPQARFIGKLTTFLQGCALPAILLSVYYSAFSWAPYLAYLTCLVGFISALTYIKDLGKEGVR